jgi:hypothetical protein
MATQRCTPTGSRFRSTISTVNSPDWLWRTCATGLTAMGLCMFAACGEDSPTSPSKYTPIASYASGTPARLAAGPITNYSGIWTGEYLLASCRSAYSGGCKDAPRRESVRLELIQEGVDLRGAIDFIGSRKAFTGFVSEGPGVSGVAESDVSVRLTETGSTLGGTFVRDQYAGSLLFTSKRYDVVTPLRRVQ